MRRTICLAAALAVCASLPACASRREAPDDGSSGSIILPEELTGGNVEPMRTNVGIAVGGAAGRGDAVVVRYVVRNASETPISDVALAVKHLDASGRELPPSFPKHAGTLAPGESVSIDDVCDASVADAVCVGASYVADGAASPAYEEQPVPLDTYVASYRGK